MTVCAACVPHRSHLFRSRDTWSSTVPMMTFHFSGTFFPKYLKKKKKKRDERTRRARWGTMWIRGVTWGERLPWSASTRSVLAYRVCTFNTSSSVVSVWCRVHPWGDVRRLNGDFLLPRSRFRFVTIPIRTTSRYTFLSEIRRWLFPPRHDDEKLRVASNLETRKVPEELYFLSLLRRAWNS